MSNDDRIFAVVTEAHQNLSAGDVVMLFNSGIFCVKCDKWGKCDENMPWFLPCRLDKVSIINIMNKAEMDTYLMLYPDIIHAVNYCRGLL